MTRDQWIRNIRESTKDAGTYKPYFESAIKTLGGILEARDSAQEQYDADGGIPMLTRMTREGESHYKNPTLVVLMDLNTQALKYWSELGLTPAGLKRINEQAMKERKQSTLAAVLAEFGKD